MLKTGHWFVLVFCQVHIAPNLYSVLNLTEDLMILSKEMAEITRMCNFMQLQIWQSNVCRSQMIVKNTTFKEFDVKSIVNTQIFN